MTKEEFGIRVQKLMKVYGEKAYTPERCSILWQEFSDVTSETFEKIIDEAIGNHMTPPPLDKMREYAKRFGASQAVSQQRSYQEWVDSLPYCHVCDMSGYAFAHHKRDASKWKKDYTFRCNCVLGKNKSGNESLELWDEVVFGDKFELQPFAPKGWDRRKAERESITNNANAITKNLTKTFSMKTALGDAS